MAGNSRVACCRLWFMNERKSHRKIQSYSVDLVDFSRSTGLMTIKRRQAWLSGTWFWLFFDHSTFGNEGIGSLKFLFPALVLFLTGVLIKTCWCLGQNNSALWKKINPILCM